VVVDGLATTVLPVVDERLAVGAQEYEMAPEAVSIVLSPEQMAVEGLVVIAGSPFTTTSIFVLGPSQLLFLPSN
jgi:hypothetical protein